MDPTNNRNGSILVMLVVVMVIIGIFASTALFDVRGTIDQERIFETEKHADNLKNAIMDFRRNNSSIAMSNLADLVSKPAALSSCTLSYSDSLLTMQIPTGWCGPYLDTSNYLATSSAYLEDAWGTGYQISAYQASSSSVSSTSSSSSSASSTPPYYYYNIKSCGENKSCGDADDISLDF